MPPSHWLARTSLTSRPRSERAGGGPAPGQEVGCCSARSTIGRAQMRSRWRAGSSPGLRALRGGQAEGPRCWDQSQTQDRRWHGPRAQGSRGQTVPQTLPSLGKPERAGGRVDGCGHGQAWCGQRPQDAPTSATTAEDCLWPASLAPFFRHPYPLGSSQTPPPHSLPGPWAPPRPRQRAWS